MLFSIAECDWLIPVNDCFGFCRVVSPGYPGIYPPNTRCQYLLTNFEDMRVDLNMGGRGHRGKFDMKKRLVQGCACFPEIMQNFGERQICGVCAR